MAGSSLLALIDDIATVLDDVAVLSKVAAKKTAGVIGDDLALNAEQVADIRSERELPVIWAVTKGSFKNKLILVPTALLISAIAPWLIMPLLMIGGSFLCYEGVEKIIHSLFHNKKTAAEVDKQVESLVASDEELAQYEKDKIKGAIRTDFILSAEIIIIVLGTVKDASFAMQVSVVSAIAILITVVVYGLVAGIVKLDDAGFYLLKDKSVSVWGNIKRMTGKGLLWFAPFLMHMLSIVGTAAMFLVGGGILLHGIPAAEPVVHHLEILAGGVPVVGGILSYITPSLSGVILGLGAGGLIVLFFSVIASLKGKKPVVTHDN